MSDQFQYDSNFDIAAELSDGLSDLDKRLFSRLDTTNFERVLGALKTARVVGEA